MSIVITGATGQVGSAVVGQAQPTKLVGVRRGKTGPSHGDHIEWIAADLRDPDFARQMPERANVVIHLAQGAGHREFPGSGLELAEVNVGATARLLDYARRSGAHRFILSSTATLYERSHRPLTESDPLRCRSFYARSKRAAELLSGGYGDLLHVAALRIFTVYGGDGRGKLIDGLCDRIAAGRALTVEGDRGLPLSPIHVSDVARAILDVATAPEREPGEETLNVCGPDALGIREIGTELGAALGIEPRIEELGGEQPPGLVGDGARIADGYGFRPLLPFADGAKLLAAERGDRDGS